MANASTDADPAATGWGIAGPVIRLRAFGTMRTYALDGASHTMGTAPECTIRLVDPSGRTSRRHAALARDNDTWMLRDLGSTNGIRRDGEALGVFPLAPGAEVGLGAITLIAESETSIVLHELLKRFIGWAPERLGDIDLALRAVRDMGHLRAGLILRGTGSLVGCARRLHRLALGEARPFVVHPHHEAGVAALDRARNGTLCLDGEALPSDICEVIAGLRLPDSRVRLVVFATSAKATAEISALVPRISTVSVTTLAARDGEIDRLLEAYGLDAVVELGAPRLGFREHDPKWVRKWKPTTLDEIDEIARRLVAVRNWGVRGGALKLGLTHGAMSRWMQRHGLPT